MSNLRQVLCGRTTRSSFAQVHHHFQMHDLCRIMHGFNLFEAVTGGSRFMRKRLNPNFCFILLSLQYKSKRILIGIRFRIRRDPPALPSRTQMQWDLQTSLSLDRPILETARAPKSQAKDKFFLLFLQLLLQQQLTTSFPLYQ